MLVCPDCFDEKGLQRRIEEIRPQFDEGKCDHHETKKGVGPVTVPFRSGCSFKRPLDKRADLLFQQRQEMHRIEDH